jgi:putative colanic acid biosynthesis UDP-glucose lipid carrier transferase
MVSQSLIQSHSNTYSALFRMLDMALIFCMLFGVAGWFGNGFFDGGYLLVGLVTAVMFLLASESFDVYRSWRGVSATRMMTVTASAWLSVCFLLIAFSFFAEIGEEYSRLVVGSWMLGSLVLLLAWRLGFRHMLKVLRLKGYNIRRSAIVGINDSAVAMREQLERHPELGFEFSGFYDDRSNERTQEEFPDCELKGSIDELIEKTRNGEYDVIFLALPLKAQKRIDSILQRCGDTTASVHLIPDFFTYNLIHARLSEVGSMQTLSIYESPISGFNDVIKRLFDICFAGCVLTVIALPMIAIALAVKLTSPGPIIFKQFRYGLDGRKIQVWKFRSMTVMENNDVVTQAKKNDKRVTKVGAFIRRTSLDELPQFINVLQGRMSVVGPRPHAVAHNEEYRKLIPYYMLRHKVKPGITGWAQINGYRGETDTLDKMSGRVDYDLDYIRNWSIWMDVKIVFLTFFKGFVGSNVH